MDHEEYRALACCTTMIPDLVSFFRRRDPLPAVLYPYLASYFEALRLESVSDHDVRVRWKTKQDVRRLYESLPRTQGLWLLTDYAEHELEYLEMARYRDRVMGIPIESDDAIFTRWDELDPCPPVCSRCSKSWTHIHQCANSFQRAVCTSDCEADEDLEDDETYVAALMKAFDERLISAYKAANLAMGLGPCLLRPQKRKQC